MEGQKLATESKSEILRVLLQWLLLPSLCCASLLAVSLFWLWLLRSIVSVL